MLRITFFLLGLLTSAQLLADPGPQIARMMQTPATAFDLFLLRLYEGAKCNNLVKNTNAEEADLCLTSIDYDADANVLTTFFRVYPGAEAMDDFVNLEAEDRKQILLQLLDNTVRRVGALDTWGLLHSTPISYGSNAGNNDEKAFRAALAARTTVALSTSYSGVVYVATRHFDGSIKYFTSQ